jgi:hypothetical protein
MSFKSGANQFFLLFSVFVSGQLYAQQELPISTNLKKTYANHTRNLNGSPGSSYWQNTANYNVIVSFTPETRMLTGTVGIHYQNNSPDTLKKLVIKLYPNLYQKQAMRNKEIAPADLTNGVDIKSFQLDGKYVEAKNQVTRGTNLFIKGVEIMPGQSSSITTAFSYYLNEGSFIRTGQVDPGAYVIAYFFPRIAVYDDIDGWNEYPYVGKEEFYNDFCSFSVQVTIPGTFQCWATGDLMNTEEVYQPEFVERIARATRGDEIVDIIDPENIKRFEITKPNPTNTWKFKAENVTDFAFTISNHFVWKSTSVVVDSKSQRRTRVDAVYNNEHAAYAPVINYARKTVALISNKIPGIPFPYTHQTIFEGLDATEYPMLVNNLPFENEECVAFTAHEIFHALFPFYVGNNETKYSFLDEGWATFAELTLSPLLDPKLEGAYDISSLNNSAGSDQDVPIMTLTPQLYGNARFSNKDLKPALGFYYLREMLGDSVFLKGLRYYINQWQGKHPTPYDFFACMNAGSGRNLNWFWKNWFFEKSVPDLAITKVDVQKRRCKIEVTNIGGAIVPVHLTVHYTDGTTQSISSSIACWIKGNKTMTAEVKSNVQIEKIVLGNPYDADIDPKNNVFMPEYATGKM